jgi:hypothetical protein
MAIREMLTIESLTVGTSINGYAFIKPSSGEGSPRRTLACRFHLGFIGP